MNETPDKAMLASCIQRKSAMKFPQHNSEC